MLQLHDIIPSSVIREILIYAIWALSISLSILFLILVFDKLNVEKREAKRRQLREKYMNFISNSLAGLKVEPEIPGKKLERDVMTDVCIDTLLSISGFIAERVKSLLKDMKLIDYYKEMGRSRLWARRFYAVEKLGFLIVDDLKDYYLDLFDEEVKDVVKEKIIWALSLIADREVLSRLTENLLADASKSAKFNEYIYTNMILSFRRKDDMAAFLSYLEEIKEQDHVPVLLKRDIIEACGSAFLHEAADTIASYFSAHDNPEMRISCIRALGKMGGGQACDLISKGFSSEDWRVRAVAASAAHLCGEDVIPYLRKLLYDQIYFVRINASKALARLGNNGLEALRMEVISQDRFVRDTAQFVLEGKDRHA